MESNASGLRSGNAVSAVKDGSFMEASDVALCSSDNRKSDSNEFFMKSLLRGM
jgi:hypothetical protein